MQRTGSFHESKEAGNHRMVRTVSCLLAFCLPLCVMAQKVEQSAVKADYGKPALLAVAELAGFDSLPDDRRKLIEEAIGVARDSPWLPYLAGGAAPEEGGFDCSGAMYYILRKVGLAPPRSSGGLMLWLRSNGRLHLVSAEATDLKHSSFAALRPGDLLFWAVAGPDGEMRVHHVAMYLGTEKKDQRPVMIGSSNGRSYRGQRSNGFGVQDLYVPAAESSSRLVGYGTPHGIGVE